MDKTTADICQRCQQAPHANWPTDNGYLCQECWENASADAFWERLDDPRYSVKPGDIVTVALGRKYSEAATVTDTSSADRVALDFPAGPFPVWVQREFIRCGF